MQLIGASNAALNQQKVFSSRGLIISVTLDFTRFHINGTPVVHRYTVIDCHDKTYVSIKNKTYQNAYFLDVNQNLWDAKLIRTFFYMK